MSDLNPRFDERRADETRAVLGEELLPPVEPPSAGFIVRLFVYPALIVAVFLAIGMSIRWVVHRTTTRPEDIIERLERGPRIARWQRASDLADMLRMERFAEFRRNPQAASRLAAILEREIEQADTADGMEEGDVTLRFFLARALGKFEVQEGIDVLLQAAKTNRHPNEQIVRYGALEAIAERAFTLRRMEPPQQLTHPLLVPTLLELASDEEPLIRSATAYALGHIGTPASLERLEVMTEDPHAPTRYNAAVALAHQGSERAVETLAEMLDLEEIGRFPETPAPQGTGLTRSVIVANAIHAAQALDTKNPSADLSPVLAALERLADAEPAALAEAQLPSSIAYEAKRALEELRAQD